jgi:hypothetical protein
MADTVALVGVVSGATVAIAVPVITSRLERRRLEWEQDDRRLDELRAVLESAYVPLDRVYQAVQETVDAAKESKSYVSESKLPQHNQQEREEAKQRAEEFRQQREEAVGRIREGVAEAEKHAIRIAIRLSNDDPLYASYRAELTAAGKIEEVSALNDWDSIDMKGAEETVTECEQHLTDWHRFARELIGPQRSRFRSGTRSAGGR